MAALIHTDDGWIPSLNSETNRNEVEQTAQTVQYTFDTAGKMVDKNIVFQINIPGVVIPTPASGTSTFYITIGGVTYNWTVDSSGNVWVD